MSYCAIPGGIFVFLKRNLHRQKSSAKKSAKNSGFQEKVGPDNSNFGSVMVSFAGDKMCVTLIFFK